MFKLLVLLATLLAFAMALPKPSPQYYYGGVGHHGYYGLGYGYPAVAYASPYYGGYGLYY